MTENNEIMVEGRVYEISFILDNKLDENAALEKVNALKHSIASLKGSFISEEAPYMRELSYEMIRVQNNINVRFNEGYFGWVKCEIDPGDVKVLDKSLKDDEQVVRHLIVKTVKENTVYTKRAPVVKMESLEGNEEDIPGAKEGEDVNIDTTKEVESKDEVVVQTTASEEVK